MIELTPNNIAYINSLSRRYRYCYNNRRAAGIRTSMRALGLDKLKAAVDSVDTVNKTALLDAIRFIEIADEKTMLKSGKSDNPQFAALLAEIEGSFADYEKKLYDSVVNQIQSLYKDFMKSGLSLDEYRDENWPPRKYITDRNGREWKPSFDGENPPVGSSDRLSYAKYDSSLFYSLIVSRGFAQKHNRQMAKDFTAYKHKEAADHVEAEKIKLRSAVGKVLSPDMVKEVKRISVNRRAKGFEGRWLITHPDGSARIFVTKSIIAEGVIVRRHYRYISHLLK